MAVETVSGTPRQSGWNRLRGDPSLSEVFGSVATRPSGSFWRKLSAFLGPSLTNAMIAIGVRVECAGFMGLVRSM